MISPYLNRPTRTLEDACEQLHINHGGKEWACADCEYRDICPLSGKVGNMVAFPHRPARGGLHYACRLTRSDE